MPGVKTNEVAGTRAVLRHYRMSAYKARQVLDLIRGRDADRAEEILNATPREAARVIGKVLASAVANARNNDQLDPDELFVSACYADEGTTLKRWRPRARGRATRIRKRTCHITVIVSRLPEDRLERRRARQATETSGLRSRRVAASRRGGDADGTETPSSQSATADADVEDLDVTSTDVDEGEGGDEVEAEVEAETDVEVEAESGTDVTEAEGEAEDFKEPEWLNDELDGPDAAAETPVETETEAEEQAPPAKPRRARARKSTTKAAPAADESDAGGSGEEEKG
jgi:large subunit ribosomal protein L22